MAALSLPLSAWAQAQLDDLAKLAGSAEIAALSGHGLLGERATLNGFTIPGKISAGGGCRLIAAATGHVALNLSRPEDRSLLPALFGDQRAENEDEDQLAARMAHCEAASLVSRGRILGLAIAALDEIPASSASDLTIEGVTATPSGRAPLVIDLSALWAGPLATSLLRLAGAEIVKVESPARPDSMRWGDPALFARLNQGKASVTLDLYTRAGRDALIALIGRADIVVEAARPRALRQLGIDAGSFVREIPGLVWMTITGHGTCGGAADWIGFGDDCAVAGGLGTALRDATGAIGFVGDACADPLAGIHAARLALARHQSGMGAHLIVSMSGVVAEALAAERRRDSIALTRSLEQWAGAVGQPFPRSEPRAVGPVAAFGADNDAWLKARGRC